MFLNCSGFSVGFLGVWVVQWFLFGCFIVV